MNKTTKAYIMLISSMLIYGTIGIFRKFIPISSPMLAFTRGILGSVCIIIFCLITKIKVFEKNTKKDNILLIVSGALIGFNWILLFEAYNYTSVSIATLCYYMDPTFVILISPFLFKEKLTPKKLICAILAIIGMILISGVIENKENNTNIIGILLGLGAAILYTAVVILNKLTKCDNSYNRTVIQLLSAAICIIPYILLTEDFKSITFNSTSIIMILIVGVIHTGFAYTLYFSSFKVLKAQSISVLSYIDPVSALILSAIILNEKLTIFGIMGAILIIGSSVISEINFKKPQLTTIEK